MARRDDAALRSNINNIIANKYFTCGVHNITYITLERRNLFYIVTS